MGVGGLMERFEEATPTGELGGSGSRSQQDTEISGLLTAVKMRRLLHPTPTEDVLEDIERLLRVVVEDGHDREWVDYGIIYAKKPDEPKRALFDKILNETPSLSAFDIPRETLEELFVTDAHREAMADLERRGFTCSLNAYYVSHVGIVGCDIRVSWQSSEELGTISDSPNKALESTPPPSEKSEAKPHPE